MTSIGPVGSSSAMSASRPTAGWGYSTDASIDEENHRAHAALTASDKDLLRSATGEDVMDGQPMSILAYTIARDRMAGKLSAGESINSEYLDGLAKTYSVSDATGEASLLSPDILKKAQSYLAANGGKAPVDFTA